MKINQQTRSKYFQNSNPRKDLETEFIKNTCNTIERQTNQKMGK